MKTLIIGANGALGKVITPALYLNHEVITVGRTSGDIILDIAKPESVETLFEQVGRVDAVICMAGDSESDTLFAMDTAKFNVGIEQKLFSQINLVLMGTKYINDNGSFTLISGKMGEKPVKGASGKAVANGALNTFVLAAALEMPRGIRINAVSPSKISNIPSEDLIDAYLKSIEGSVSGQIIRINY